MSKESRMQVDGSSPTHHGVNPGAQEQDDVRMMRNRYSLPLKEAIIIQG